MKVPQPHSGTRERSKEGDSEGWSSWDDQDSGGNGRKQRPRSKLGSSPASLSPSRSSPSPNRGAMDEANEVGEGRSEGSSPRSGSGKVGVARSEGSGSSGGGPPLATSTPSKPAPTAKSQVIMGTNDLLVPY